MNGMELFAEAVETVEQTNETGLAEQREALQEQIEKAQAAGNEELANYYSGEIAELEQQFGKEAGIGNGEISFGSKNGEQIRAERNAKSALKSGNQGAYKYWRGKAIDAAVDKDIKEHSPKK